MNSRTMKIPGPDHPIRITRTLGQVGVRVGGRLVADSRRALSLAEAAYPVVQYLPLADVAPALLTPSAHRTWCPYKGECRYYDLTVDGERLTDVAWAYDDAFEAVAAIRGHVAFYTDRVDLRIEPL